MKLDKYYKQNERSFENLEDVTGTHNTNKNQPQKGISCLAYYLSMADCCIPPSNQLPSYDKDLVALVRRRKSTLLYSLRLTTYAVSTL